MMQEGVIAVDENSVQSYPLSNKEWPIPTVPKDADGFVQSFECDDVANYMKFFDDYGFVVINNVLTTQEIQSNIEEIWDELEKTTNPHGRFVLVLLLVL